MKFLIYKDKAKEWRWRLVAANGKIIGDSGEGYKKITHCRNMVKEINPAIPFETAVLFDL